MSAEWMSERRHYPASETGKFLAHRTRPDIYGAEARPELPFNCTNTQLRAHQTHRKTECPNQDGTQLFNFRMRRASTLPFSGHDNRYGHEMTGVHMDKGLGRRKGAYHRREHHSYGLKWNPTDDARGDVSTQHEDFQNWPKHWSAPPLSRTRQFRRFPKIYPTQQDALPPVAATGWENGHSVIPMHVLAAAQEPRLKTEPWVYATHRFHN